MSRIVITYESRDMEHSFDEFTERAREYDADVMDLDFNSPDDEILEAVSVVLAETEGVDIRQNGEYTYSVKRAEDSGNIYVLPKAVMG